MAGPVQTLVIRITGDAKSFGAAMTGVQSKLATTQAKMASVGSSMTKGLSLPLLAVGAVAVGSAMKMDGAMDTIRSKTGKTGTALQGLGKDFRSVMSESTSNTKDLSEAFGDLQTRTGLTGKPLRDLAGQLDQLARVTGENLGGLVRETTRVFGDWSIATGDQSEALDYLYKVSQNTGIGVSQLSNLVVTFGAPMRQLGFSFEQTAALMGKWEKEGVNVEKVAGGMKIALGKMAKEGKEPREELARLTNQIKSAGSAGEANAVAVEAFGSRAGPDMAAAIREGRFEIDDFVSTLQKSPETIKRAADDTLSLSDKMQILKNKVILAAEPLGNVLVGAIERLLPAFQKVLGFVANVFEKFSNLPQGVQTAVIAFGAVAVAAGPLLSIGGRVIGIFSKVGKAASGIGSGISAAARWIGGLGGSMNSLKGVAAGMQTPLLATSSATGEIGKTAATSASKFGSFASAALPVAGILAGVGLATWQCISADNKAEEARRKGIIAASDMTGSLDDLRAKTADLTVGTQEHTAAMEAQAAKAQEIVEKTGLVGAIFDETGKVIDADTQFINMMADGYRKGTEAEVAMAQATARGTVTLGQGMKVHSQYGLTAEKAKTKLDEFKNKMYEKMRAGQELSASDQVILSALTRDWQNASQRQGGALDSMQKAVDAFGVKLSGPTGLSAVTKRDLNSMTNAMANTSPKVREKGLAMFQQIVNAEAAKNPAIQANMQTIMSGIKNRIDNLPARERTAAKMDEIIASEMAKAGPISSEMQSIVDGMSGKIPGWDARGQITTQMGIIESGISQSTAVTKFGELVGSLTSGWDNMSLADKSTTIDVWVNYAEKTAERQGKKPHSGGGINKTGWYEMQAGEEVIRRSAAKRFDPRFFRMLNAGIMPTGEGGSVVVEGGVHIHSASEKYDARVLMSEFDKLARRANHTGRLLRRGDNG